jgi:hypothetical protein
MLIDVKGLPKCLPVNQCFADTNHETEAKMKTAPMITTA